MFTRWYIFSYDVKDAIKELKAGKSAGMDGLGSEHYNYADERLYVLFSLHFTSINKRWHVDV